MSTISKILLSAMMVVMWIGTSWSFTIPTPKLQRPPRHSSIMSLAASSMREDQSSSAAAGTNDEAMNGASVVVATAANSIVDPLDAEAVWQEQLKSEEVQEVRRELIQKYLSMGIDRERAERDVDAFLSDREKSLQYLEMRRYAAAQADELGPDFLLQLLGAFFFGFLANVGVKYLSAYKVRFT